MDPSRFHNASRSWLRSAGTIAATRGHRRPRKLAGLITMLAVGVGLALTKAELDRRRSSAQSARARRFSMARGESLGSGLQRMALGQLDLAIELLEDPPAGKQEWTIHEIRKSIKRLRALLRLTRGALGERRFTRENRVLRNCARTLAGARDAEVMLATLQVLVDRHPKRLRRSAAVRRLRSRLESEREDALGESPLAGENRLALLGELRAVRARAMEWRFADRGFALVTGELEEIYRGGRRSLRRARKVNDGAALHEWRKRVKDLRYAAQMLCREKSRSKDSQWMARVDRRADRLGEVLGDEHDLALLAQRIDEHREAFAGDKRTRKILRRLIAKRRKRLRAQALELGERLYQSTPRRFLKRADRSLSDV